MDQIIIIGYGNHAKVIAEVIHDSPTKNLIGYIDPKNYNDEEVYLGNDGDIQDVIKKNPDAEFIIGVGDIKIRRKVIEQFSKYNLLFHKLVHPSAIVMSSVEIGEGTVIFANAVVNSYADIDKHCIINTSSVVEHHNKLGENVHVAPGSVLGGQVVVDDNTLIGIGASIRNNVIIGTNVVVGCGGVVVKNVNNGSTVMGNPAR